MSAAWTVFRKELLDALRDRRTLLTVLLSAVATGPLVLALLSSLSSEMQKRAEAREVMVFGLQNAPTLRNFLLRQGDQLRQAPADYEQQLLAGQLGQAVLVVEPGFEAALAAGQVPLVTVVGASGNQRAEGTEAGLLQQLQAFNHEQALLRLAVRGVAPQLLAPVEVAQRDLASPAARSARLTAMLPFLVLMAVLYGALNAALDSTAGERERGSLEPLLMNPAARCSLVLGKWGAVTAVALLIAALSSFSYLPSQRLLRSEALAAMFQYGWPQALAFLALLAPLASAAAALLMALAMRCKSVKEAQANAAVVVMLVSMLPMVTLFSRDGEQAWQLWVPALAQSVLMNRVLRGEMLAWADLGASALSCVVVTLLCLAWVARQLSRLASR